MAALMLLLTAVVAVLGLNRIAELTLGGLSANAWLFAPLGAAVLLFTALAVFQKNKAGRTAFLLLYLRAHLMAIASIVTIYMVLVRSGAGTAAPAAVIACAVFMLAVAAAMWRITEKFKIWE